MNQVIIIESDRKALSNYERMLESKKEDMNCSFFQYPEEAIEYITSHPTAVVVCELNLPVMSGKEVFDMVEILSPDTIKIAMSKVENVAETLDIMNQSRIFKLIIKPFFLTEDLAEPIMEGLQYYNLKREEDSKQQDMSINMEYLDRRTEELTEKLEKKKRSYAGIYHTAIGIIQGNLGEGIAGMSREESQITSRVLEDLFQNFVRYYIFENRNYSAHADYLTELFHHPEEECIFQMKDGTEHEIPDEVMQQIAYTIFVMGYLSTQLLKNYQAVAVIEEEENHYLIKMFCKYSDEEAVYKIKSEKVRMLLLEMVETIVKSLSQRYIRGTADNPFLAKVYFERESV